MTGFQAVHVDPMTLVDYARGELSRERAVAVREHCMGCEDCGDQLAAVMLLRQGVEERARFAGWRRTAALAAAVAIVTVGAAIAVRAGGWIGADGVEGGPLAVAEGPASAADEEAVALQGLPAPLRDPVFRTRAGGAFRVFVLLAEDVGLQVDAAAGPTLPAHVAELFREGDFAGAAESLSPFAEHWNAVGTPLLGASLYLAGRTGEAEPILTEAFARLEAVPEDSRIQSLRLFLALTLLERGRPGEATELLRPFERAPEPGVNGGVFYEQGHALLQEIASAR